MACAEPIRKRARVNAVCGGQAKDQANAYTKAWGAIADNS